MKTFQARVEEMPKSLKIAKLWDITDRAATLSKSESTPLSLYIHPSYTFSISHPSNLKVAIKNFCLLKSYINPDLNFLKPQEQLFRGFVCLFFTFVKGSRYIIKHDFKISIDFSITNRNPIRGGKILHPSLLDGS